MKYQVVRTCRLLTDYSECKFYYEWHCLSEPVKCISTRNILAYSRQ